MRIFTYLSLFSSILLQLDLSAQELEDNKKRYTLFNPVPRSAMREFSIDRPDVTESPMTVDAGHFQFEGDLVKWTRSRHGDSERTINIMNGLYKIGLMHSWDLHVGIELNNIYQDVEGETYDRGYGSTTIRLKHNLWGNDGGTQTALGMIPYVTFSPENDVTYGVGFPFSYDLTEKIGLGAQPQFDFIPNEEDGHDLSYFQTIVVGGPLIGALDFYVEGVGTFYHGTSLYSANGGLIYNVQENVKVDVATNQGLNQEAPTRFYLGLSFRI